MIIQLRRLLIHNVLRLRHRILPLQLKPLHLFLIRIRVFRHNTRSMIHLLLRMLIDEQILDLALPRRRLIDSEAGRKLVVRADLDCVQHGDGEVLAIVADYVVGGARKAHVVDYHLACDMLGMLFEEVNR